MKISRHLTYILAGLTLGSCTSHFDLEGIEAEEKLVVYCLPTAGCDTTIIQVSKTVPLQSSGLPPRGIPGAFIDFCVNGERQEVQWAEMTTGMVPRESYYVVRKLNVGDRIDIVAEAKGLTAVTSSSVVPGPFPFVKAESGETSDEDGKWLQFRVTFRDDASTEDYYGIRVLRVVNYTDSIRSSWEDKWNCSTYTRVYVQHPNVSGEPLLNNKVGLDATFDFDYNYYQDLCVWDDKRISGEEYTLKIGVTPTYDVVYENNGNIYRQKFSYKLCLYRLSPDLYSFLKSMSDIGSNELGQNGLAPIRSHFSNIINGFGIVGACNLYEIDTISDGDTDE